MSDHMKNSIKPNRGQTSRIRAALLTNIPAPYRLPFFEELSNLCDLTVLFDALSEPNRQWALTDSGFRFPYQILSGLAIPFVRRRNVTERRFLQLRFDIILRLIRLSPDVVISAEMGPRSLQAEAYCHMAVIPLVIWWEGTQHTEGTTSRLKQLIRKYLVRRGSRFWANGKESASLLQAYGADSAKIDLGMTGVDTLALSSEVKKAISNRNRVRSELGIDGTVILFMGQLVERKGISQYLAALDLLYRDGVRKWSALFVGSGGLQPDIKNWSKDHPEIHVTITGFIQPRDLPQFLSAADVFVLPTLDDNWALAPLEALAAGLPQLFSIYNGCTTDLLIPGITGKKIDPLKTDEFAATIREWIDSPPARLSSEQIAKILEYYSPPAMARRGLISLQNTIREARRG